MESESDFTLSSGTLATLTGRRRYVELHLIGDSFALWAMTCGRRFPNWMQAWNEFYSA